MSKQSRIVCVSNRVSLPDPVTGEIKAGGLAVGVRAAMESMNGGLWVGWDGRIVNDFATREKLGTAIVHSNNIEFATIPLVKDEHEAYYKAMANEGLWPFLHGLLEHIEEDGTSFKTYMRVNNLFAKTLKPLLRPDDIVWVHDYHLIPLAGSMRSLGINNKVGFFLHIPIPEPEQFYSPEVPESLRIHVLSLLQSLFNYDQVGFQSERDLKNFCKIMGIAKPTLAPRFNMAALGKDGRSTQFGFFPISIETRQLAKSVATTDQLDAKNQLQFKRFVEASSAGLGGNGKKVLVAGRLDYTKGLVEGINGADALFSQFPEHIGETKFIQIATKSRDDIEMYRRIIDHTRRSVANINAKYGDELWQPFMHSEKDVPRERLIHYYRESDAMMITALRDGQNLVAKEWVAAQDPNDPGVLILSRETGAAEELTDALLVDPRKPDSVAAALHQALTMPLEERVARHQRLLAVIEQNDVHNWATKFIEPLQAANVNRPALRLARG